MNLIQQNLMAPFHKYSLTSAACDFIQKRQNIVMISNPGRGKTHLAISLGLKACYYGYKVLFKTAPRYPKKYMKRAILTD